jgi:hypothetical protein
VGRIFSQLNVARSQRSDTGFRAVGLLLLFIRNNGCIFESHNSTSTWYPSKVAVIFYLSYLILSLDLFAMYGCKKDVYLG